MAGTDLVKQPQDYAALQMAQTDLREVIQENLAGQAIGEFDLDRVKVPSGGGIAWEVPTLDGAESMKELEGVIVYWKDTRSYWEEKFSGGGSPPDCSAPDAQFATGNPGVEVPTAENGRFICEQCPHSQFGSAVNEKGEPGAGQACKLSRQLFMLMPDVLIPVVISLAPTSVASAKKYMLRLASAGVPYSAVITKVGLEKTKSNDGIEYAKATFSMAARLEGEQAERVREYAQMLRPTFDRTSVRQDEVMDPAGGGVEV